MALLQVLLEAIWVVGGSLLAAILFSWVAWTIFKQFHHPELGVPILLAAVLLLFHEHFVRDSFLQMMAFYAVLGEVGLWPAGRAWFHDHYPRGVGGKR
ncbi:hypothetical protein WBP06_19160 [Novosphingobium sp. BL-8H]|uniref:hypothetical protein n=1 Tax=Novosphingobium sp. BL-8H TaxID=3127640 RepID=UPI0037580E77